MAGSRRFYVDFGTTLTGPLGCTFNVEADTKEQALTEARRVLDACVGDPEVFYSSEDHDIRIYFNSKFLTLDDIEEG
jgi:uncharacterized protein YneR